MKYQLPCFPNVFINDEIINEQTCALAWLKIMQRKTSLFQDCEHHQRDNWCVALLSVTYIRRRISRGDFNVPPRALRNIIVVF